MRNDIPLLLYGFDINSLNKYVNFKNAIGGPVITAELRVGNYTATQFMAEMKRAMEFIDGVYKYTWAIDRTINSGLTNEVTVTTTAPYFDLLFGSGPNYLNSPRPILGFDQMDYTGALQYTGSTHAGSILIPEYPTYDYLGPDDMVTNDGVKNVSASGVKETLVFAQMFFIQGEWKYITNFGGRTQHTEWQNFLKYATRQLQFEFTPSINEDPETFYQVTLESTGGDSNGMGYTLKQMRGEGLYRFYGTGTMKMRVIPG